MINNIERADLREEPAHGLVVFLPVSDGPRPVLKTRRQRGATITSASDLTSGSCDEGRASPVVSPFNHGSWLKTQTKRGDVCVEKTEAQQIGLGT